MQLNIPNKRAETEQQFINIEKSLVIIGANGAGKTRFGTQIENGYPGETHRVSAQKSLKMSGSVSIVNLEKAKSEFINGYYQEQVDTQQHIANRVNIKWGQNPNTHFLDDFDKLLVFLQTLEMYELSANKNKQTTIITPLDRVKRIWEEILPHRKLKIQGLTIQTYPTDNESGVYLASEMSDGERIIFYMIGVAL